jgi:hypothetical protein
MLSRWLGALAVALASSSALADSVAGQASLAPAADCQSNANVAWSFTYTTNPAREFGRITIPAGTEIGGYEKPSPLTGGSFNGTWIQPITLPQPPNTLIGTYGGAGDNPPTANNTAEFFVLYNCTTRQVLYECTGNLGTCPTTALEGLNRISEGIPSASPAALAAMLLALLWSGGRVLERRSVRRASR